MSIDDAFVTISAHINYDVQHGRDKITRPLDVGDMSLLNHLVNWMPQVNDGVHPIAVVVYDIDVWGATNRGRGL
eukprot:5873922-Amphidinium_carterae.1